MDGRGTRLAGLGRFRLPGEAARLEAASDAARTLLDQIEPAPDRGPEGDASDPYHTYGGALVVARALGWLMKEGRVGPGGELPDDLTEAIVEGNRSLFSDAEAEAALAKTGARAVHRPAAHAAEPSEGSVD